MSEMETFAIAARLHVVMRRALGRVTDVEWMTRNRDYASEVIRLARGHADAELRDLADKFEAILAPQKRAEPPRRVVPAPQAGNDVREMPAQGSVPVAHAIPAAPRYVGRLR